eukprot:TRINITY_DN7304_c0_g1_i1.p1 TRINITY_DN7304_c0_g1~~TRINITY_DN7304_c0_g1_i1.p1  ORF type:complete len:856 (-),score=148.73 TRINITY_DN7304_c0_g1_i1:27-2594(-)
MTTTVLGDGVDTRIGFIKCGTPKQLLDLQVELCPKGWGRSGTTYVVVDLQQRLIKAGGIEAIITRLSSMLPSSSSSTGVVADSAGNLRAQLYPLLACLVMDGPNPSTDPVHRNQVGKDLAIQFAGHHLLIDALKAPSLSDVATSAAAWALSWISRWSTTRVALIGTTELIKTVTVMIGRWRALPTTAIGCAYLLSNLVYNSDTRSDAAMHASAMETLSSCLTSKNNTLASTAASAIGNLIHREGNLEKADERVVRALYQNIVPSLLDMANAADLHAQQRAVMCLSRMAQCSLAHDNLIKHDVGDLFVQVSRSQTAKTFTVESATAGIAFLYGPSEEKEPLLAEAGAIKLLIKRFRQALEGDTCFSGVRPMATALALLAINDHNAEVMVSLGVLPLLTAGIAYSSDPITMSNCVTCCAQICFVSEAARNAVRAEPGLIAGLQKASLAYSHQTDSDIFRNGEGALWLLGERRVCRKTTETMTTKCASNGQSTTTIATTTTTPSEGSGSGDSLTSKEHNHHVMISYAWTHQAEVLQLRSMLKDRGIKVWIDVEQMAGSTLAAMAKAVEDSCCIIYTLSEAYQNSVNCRLEAEYAQSLHKRLIPLNMQPSYRASGWLGLLLGSRMWYDCSCSSKMTTNIEGVLREIGTNEKGVAAAPAASDVKKTGTKRTEPESGGGFVAAGATVDGPNMREMKKRKADLRNTSNGVSSQSSSSATTSSSSPSSSSSSSSSPSLTSSPPLSSSSPIASPSLPTVTPTTTPSSSTTPACRLWSLPETVAWLGSIGLGHIAPSFESENMTGRALNELFRQVSNATPDLVTLYKSELGLNMGDWLHLIDALRDLFDVPKLATALSTEEDDRD